ncbi:Retrovirus-related Pol poly from transposon TNT 1-94 [Paramuricea clavata]|uniref:Retrovirus-related Pol poly from transposon TNT 1-94 n=2 Tax=Paramuricea clavata TaxID=317549 RepID=A0A7D9E057_PARCT|nr:Retrovirus-related Pol poly from transposon TNT 1-94 [Paramuricea clavata]
MASTGYGPSRESRWSRLTFDGNESNYELWEAKFLAYMRLLKLKDTILPSEEEADATKNEECYAELLQCLDDTSLSLVMRDATDDGRKALQILRDHYANQGKPRIITLYTELTSLEKALHETVTDYLIRAEKAITALKNAKETLSDGLIIAMILKGLPDSYKPFSIHVTQSASEITFAKFKSMLRSFEETEKLNTKPRVDQVMKAEFPSQTMTCYGCGKRGHLVRECPAKSERKWCNYHKSTTHSDSTCRSQQKSKDQAKRVSEKENTSKDEHSFAFKVNDEATGKINRMGMLVDTGSTSHIVTTDILKQIDMTFKPSKHYINWLMAHEPATTSNGAELRFAQDTGELTLEDGTIVEIEEHGRLYYLTSIDSHENDSVSEVDKVNFSYDINTWHEILGHCNFEDIIKLQGVVKGMKFSGKIESSKLGCNTCVGGKFVNSRSRIPDARSQKSLEKVHVDLAGPVSPVSREGFKYCIAFTDDFSGAVFVYFLKCKSDTFVTTEKFLADITPYGKVSCIRSDNGSEFTGKAFQTLLRERGIKHETSAPYSPHQNGTAERHWRTLFEMGRCLLLQSGLPKALWPYAIQTAAHIRNRCFNKRTKTTPYFSLTGKVPDLSKMWIFGSECFAYEQEHKKLDSRCSKGVFVGYDKNSPSYLVYYPKNGKIMKHRLIRFIKKCSVEQHTQTDESSRDCDVHEKSDHDTRSDLNSMSLPVLSAMPPNTVPDEEPRDSEGRHCNHTENDKAMGSPQAREWEQAMKEEISSLKENDTYELSTLPEGKASVGGKWVYTTKQDQNGIESFKVRYVAKGYSQKQVDDKIVIVIVWVDDLIIASDSMQLMEEFKKSMKIQFKMKDLGRITFFLGMDFKQSKGEIKINQKRFILKILERFGMIDCKPRLTPCEQRLEFNCGKLTNARQYREMIGSLIYAMTCRRPDLSWIVSRLSQTLSNPRTGDLIAAKHVLSDSDWASCLEDRRSTTGYCCTLTEGGPLISWKSRTQPTVAISTCEAEYVALANTAQECLYLTQLLNGMYKKVHQSMKLQLNIEDLKIKNNQHAFTQHRSTVSALISTTQTWFNATDCSKTGKMGVHAAFIDFRKAFDLVDHNILLNKLAAMNINKPFWLWVKSFLSGRVQQVNLNGTLSSIATCPVGVPQGSVISPILFNTYIDDLEDALPEQLKVSTNKYADDCTQHQIVSVDFNSNLQQSINEVNNWAVLNKMAINAKKTKDMWISFTDAIPEPPRLRIGNELIERVNAFKLLGVSFQNNLKWNAHVEEITRKANKRLYHLRECRKSQLPAEVGIITYQSKIRPILEYASPVWAGLPNYLRDEIERVQSRSLRILGLEKDYLPPLNERREEATSREVDRFMNDPHHPCRSVLPKLINNQYNLRNIDRNRNISFFSGTERHKHSFSGRACKYV